MMRLSISLLILGLFSSQAHAGGNCLSEAVRAAKENSFSTSILYSVKASAVSKPYLIKYEVTLSDQSEAPTRIETYAGTLMKSDCSIVFVSPDL